MDLHNKLFRAPTYFVARNNNSIKGFTLIEILIVIVIISIISSITALTISHNQQKQYENLAQSLAQIITLAQEEAMLRSVTLGIAFTANSFQLFEYDNQLNKNTTHWHALTNTVFGIHHFPQTIKIIFKIQNKDIILDGRPHSIISTSGDVIPFIIWIGKEDRSPSYQVTGYANGSVISGVFHEK
jgi:general secretion pathway protein H